MWVWVDHLTVLVLDASLSAATLLSLVALIMLGCQQPARRIRLARAAILCSLAIIPIVAFAPLPRFEPINALRDAGLLGTANGERAEIAASPVSSGAGQVVPTSDSELVAGDSVHAWRLRWPLSSRWTGRVLTAAYLAGLTLGLALFVLGCWGLVFITSRSHDPSPTALALYNSLPFERNGRRPRLRIATRIRRPVLLGVFRQTILIPVDLDLTDASAQLRLSLLHELAHSESADHWFSVAGSLAQAFWFFLPPLWWIRAQMRLDHEFLADRRAARGFGPLQSYASSLLDLANPNTAAGGAPIAAPVASDSSAGTGSALFLRMLMLVRCPFAVEHRPPAWWCWLLPAVVIVAMLASSSLRLRWEEAGRQDTGQPTAKPVTGPHSFRVARLTIPERSANSHGRAPVFELPMRLPARFDLALDVWGDAATLAHTRVAGLPLELANPSKSGAIAPAGWHRVTVARTQSGIALQVDGAVIACAPDAVMTGWLSVEPAPDHPGQFQNLTLSW